jgi:hypothetical protein
LTGLRDLIKERPVHERKVEIRTYPLEEGEVLVEGILTDTRLTEGYRWDGAARGPGVIHRMSVLMRLGGMPLCILEAEAQMHDIPHGQCPETLDSVKRIIGLSVTAGFTTEVRRRLGGTKGCTHLTSLIISMAPAALHGFWTAASRNRHPIPASLEDFPALQQLTNSCALWREGGPLIKEIEETIRRLTKDDNSDL